MMAFSMSWMVEYFYSTSHGFTVLHTGTSATSTQNTYIARKYKDAIVIFDSYENMNTKGMTHQRWSKGKAGATVTAAANMTTTMKMVQFFANQKNKQQFIFVLSTELEKSNCKTYQAPGDADVLIVQKAVQSVITSKTVPFSKDNDLIVLLCYHACLDSHDLFFCPEPKKNTKNFCI